MRIGIPREIKTLEGRVGLIPAAAAVLVRQGHEVFMQSGAGKLSGYPDEAYSAAGPASTMSLIVLSWVSNIRGGRAMPYH